MDREMIRDLGFEVVGETPSETPALPLVDRVTLTSRKVREAKGV
jgi:hypothetical protein